MNSTEPASSAATDPRTPWGRAAGAESRALDMVADASRASAGAAMVTAGALIALTGADGASLVIAAAIAVASAFETAAGRRSSGQEPRARRRGMALAALATGVALGALTAATAPTYDSTPALVATGGALIGVWLRAGHPAPALALAAGALGVPLGVSVAGGENAGAGAWLLWLVLALALARGASQAHRRASRLAIEADETARTLATVAERLEQVESAGDADPAIVELCTSLLADSRDALLVIGADGAIARTNDRANALLGPNAGPGEPFAPLARLLDSRSRAALDDPARQVARRGTAVRLFGEQTLLQVDDGRELNVDIRATPLPGGATLLAIADVTEALALSELSDWHTTHDVLTGLANRSEFIRRVDAAANREQGAGGPASVCYVDLDGLDAFNDAWGLQAGDAILQGVAQAMKSVLRESDLLGRLGGNRFAALLPGCPADRALRVAENLRQCVAGYRAAAGTVRLRASIGVAELDAGAEPSVGAGPLIAARLAALAARDAGGDRVHAYHPEDAAVIERAELGRWLRGVRDAVSAGRLRLLGQPIRPVSGEGPPHVEVLVRVPDGDGGMTTPETFIAAAEHLGMMPEVDRWVLVRTLEVMAGDPSDAHGFDAFAVNLSAQSLGDPEFAAFAAERIKGAGIDATRLIFEITETAVLGDVERAERTMAALRALGCRFALDDFGTGHSSYARLRRLDVDLLKIDGTLIRDVADDPADRAVVESINRVAHALGMRTVAEHVSSAQVLQALEAIGVDYVQGSAIGEPAPIEPDTVTH